MTINVVQATPSNSLTPTITATGTPYHSLIVCVQAYNGSSTPSVSTVTIGGVDMVPADGVESSGYLSWIYYLSKVASGETAVVVSGSNLNVDSYDGGVDIIEVDCPIVLDGHNHNSGDSTSSSTGSSGILSVAEEIAIGAIAELIPSDSAGWTDVGTGYGRVSAYKQVSSTSALNFTANGVETSNWVGAIATFRRGALGNNAGAFMGLIL